MSQGNPFAKFVPNPSSVPDPNKITLQQLEKYNSLEIEKLNALFRALRRSAPYVGGVLGLCLAAAWWGERQARSELFGADSTRSAMQTREAATSTCSPTATRSTTPTTASSSACSTWPRPRRETPRSTLISCCTTSEWLNLLTAPSTSLRNLPTKSTSDELEIPSDRYLLTGLLSEVNCNILRDVAITPVHQRHFGNPHRKQLTDTCQRSSRHQVRRWGYDQASSC